MDESCVFVCGNRQNTSVYLFFFCLNINFNEERKILKLEIKLFITHTHTYTHENDQNKTEKKEKIYMARKIKLFFTDVSCDGPSKKWFNMN